LTNVDSWKSRTRQSGKKKPVLARHVHNDRLVDALNRQAFAALRTSPGARAVTTTNSAPAASATTPHCANSATTTDRAAVDVYW
jgi:hypothetical protein